MNGGDLRFEGTLEAKHLPGGEGALPNEPPRTYPDFYVRPTGENPKPKLSLWHRFKLWRHSRKLQKQIDRGEAPRGHTHEPD